MATKSQCLFGSSVVLKCRVLSDNGTRDHRPRVFLRSLNLSLGLPCRSARRKIRKPNFQVVNAGENFGEETEDVPEDIEALVKIESLWNKIDPTKTTKMSAPPSNQQLEEEALSAFPSASSLQSKAEALQKEQISTALEKALGQLKGSPCDPLQGREIPFSQFWYFAQSGVLKFLEYGEHGRVVSVILPHLAKGSESVPQAKWNAEWLKRLEKSGQPLVWRRHKVTQMPADAHTQIWTQLRAQPSPPKIFFTRPDSAWAQTLPTLQLSVIWAVRLAAAFLPVFALVSVVLSRFRPKTMATWPVFKEESLASSLERQLGSLGYSRARMIKAEESTGASLADFAGQAYVKREVQELIRILKGDPEYEAMGVYCPRGLMLHGPPGTGKTLLARAIAGEAGLPFFSASGAEFVEMFAGIAASRVRDLFEKARMFAPAIIFIDEIDAIGVARGAKDGTGGSLEREQGLIQILTEMDGFSKDKSKILVIGATNRVDMLDPALLRKGRFDKILNVGRPTLDGRRGVLQVHAKNKIFRSEEEKTAVLDEVARLTDGYTGAELMNVLNEASILAARYDKDFIERSEVLEAIDRQEGKIGMREVTYPGVRGPSRTLLAYREAACAVLHCCFPVQRRPFTKVDMRFLGKASNMSFSKSKYTTYFSKKEMIENMVRTCAPALVQDMVFGGKENPFWGQGSTIAEAVQIADYIVLQTGQTAFGPVVYADEKDLVPSLRPKLVALREEFLRFAIQKCESVLVEHQPALEALVAVMLEKDEILAEEIWDIFNRSERLSPPPVRAIDEYYALMDCGRWGIHGVSLPGRATFFPGNSGYVTFGTGRPFTPRNEDTYGAKSFLDSLEASRRQRMKEQKEIEKVEGDLLVSLESVV